MQIRQKEKSRRTYRDFLTKTKFSDGAFFNKIIIKVNLHDPILTLRIQLLIYPIKSLITSTKAF